MARGPFQGTYQAGLRPTIVTAPDALVYINGELDLSGCPSCHRKFDLGQYITSVQVDLSVESAPGSATIALSIPRYCIDDFYFDGNPIICPMMEVEIFAKGYYTLEGVPQYYPIFWGLVTEVGSSYSSGEHTVSIHCADILKWWEICKMNINPAFTQSAGQMGRSLFQNVFFGTNPFDVIWSLAQQVCGDVMQGSGSLLAMVKENGQKQTFTNAMGDIMRYWAARFARMRSNLLLYGTSGTAVRGDAIFERLKTGKGTMGVGGVSSIIRTASGGDSGTQMGYDPTDPGVCALRRQFSQAGQVNFWQSEFQTKLELANMAKTAIGYEFYMDVTGDIVFKPPFYNMDILSNKPVSWIQDIDIIDFDLSESEAEVVTQIVLQGNFGGNTDYGMPEECTPFTTVTDYHLLRKYGWRQQTFNSEFLSDTMLMFYTGLDMLDRYNSKRHRATITIPCRPELRLGFPIYLAPFDQIWYIQGISHNIAFGGRATTALTLTAKRTKFISPKLIGQLSMKYEGSAQASGKGNSGGKPAPGGNQPGGTGGAQAVPNANSPDAKTGYSARQLSKNAMFTLKCTDGMDEMPAVPPPQDGGVEDTNAYEPLVLRHPKTGRILGYPNMVMVYSHAMTDPPPVTAVKTGSSPKQKPSRPKNLNKNNRIKDMDTLNQQVVADIATAAEQKYVANRYQYGLNSAGVYVYAYDQSKTIQELLLLPKERMKIEPPNLSLFEGQTGMIRPVSDERGFELIGHYRYGRGMSLRDGSLVLNPSGGNNMKVDIGSQVALTGDLYASLNAQSQGLTSIQTQYPNPADAMARLMPDDLASAAVINPSTGNPVIVSSDTNFIDTAPLGSPQQKGAMPSVEATQLSRALTLAEMAARDSLSQAEAATECSCMMGRAELTFINTGYQVKTLVGTGTDVSQLPNAKGPIIPTGGEQALADMQANTPTDFGLGKQNQKDFVNKVDSFLWNLYSVLDTPHTDYENAIRGGNMAQSPEDTDPNKWMFSQPPSQQDPLAPPFNAINRGALGDPAAALASLDSAASNLVQAVTGVGQDLKNAASIALLQGKVQADQKNLSQLQQQLATYQQENVPGSTSAISLPKAIADTQAAIAKATQQLAQDQQALAAAGAKAGKA